MHAVALEVRHGLYVAGGHLHHHGCSPFGLGGHQHLAEFALENVLDGYVDGGGDVVAVDGGSIHSHVGAAGAYAAALHARSSVEEAVESALKAVAAYDAVVVGGLANTADAEFGHASERIAAHHLRLYHQPRVGRLEAAEKGCPLDAVGLLACNLLGDAPAARTLFLGHAHAIAEVLHPLPVCLLGEPDGEAVGNQGYGVGELDDFEGWRAQVQAHVVVAEVGGKDGAVGSKDVAALRHNHLPLRQGRLGHGVPCLAVHGGGAHQRYGYGQGENQSQGKNQPEAAYNEHIAAAVAGFFVFIHLLLLWIGVSRM